ncbi:hypothetical protein [Polymorphospora rubra]|uniref:hypothetical protein n=1 Tax=Polymorphospora rubra TaxID=338584 RepID=UPI00340B369C
MGHRIADTSVNGCWARSVSPDTLTDTPAHFSGGSMPAEYRRRCAQAGVETEEPQPRRQLGVCATLQGCPVSIPRSGHHTPLAAFQSGNLRPPVDWKVPNNPQRVGVVVAKIPAVEVVHLYTAPSWFDDGDEVEPLQPD